MSDVQSTSLHFPRRIVKPHWLWLPFGLGSLVWFGIALASPWPVEYLLAWLLAMVALVPIGRRVSRRDFDLFDPINAICVLYVIYFSVAAVFDLNTPDKPGRLDLPFEAGVARGLCFATIALVALQCGYAFARRRPSPVPEALRPPPGNRVFITALAVYFVGLMARIYGVSKGLHIKVAAAEIYGQYSGVDIFYDYLGFLSTYGFILMAADRFASGRRTLGRTVALALMFPLELFFAFLAGPKEYFLPIVLSPVIVYHYTCRRVSFRHALAPVLVFALVVFPVMTSYRSIEPSDIRRLAFWDGVEYGLTTVAKEVSSRTPLEYASWSAYLMTERMDGIYTFTAVVESVPDTLEYQWGKTIVVGVAMLVPTFLWESKYDYLATVITWGSRIFGPAVTGSGISITQPGEFFLNFGPFGMVAGMMLLGYGIATLHRWLLNKGFFGVLILAVLFPALVIPEYPIAAYYSNAIKQMVLLLIIGWLAGSRTPAAAAILHERTSQAVA